VIVFVALYILTSPRCAVVVATPSYVGVSVGNSFEYTDTMKYVGNYSYEYTYDVTMIIDNITESIGITSIGIHLFLRNATFSTVSYEMINVKEGTTVIDYTARYIVNKNIPAKSYNNHPDDNYWRNGTWDANGVFLTHSTLEVYLNGHWSLVTVTRKDSTLLVVIVFVVIGVGVLGVFVYFKKYKYKRRDEVPESKSEQPSPARGASIPPEQQEGARNFLKIFALTGCNL
jgi:hypothetical protein